MRRQSSVSLLPCRGLVSRVMVGGSRGFGGRKGGPRLCKLNLLNLAVTSVQRIVNNVLHFDTGHRAIDSGRSPAEKAEKSYSLSRFTLRRI